MKISVIVPIYNVESYLRNCLDSIRSQTHRALEVILVDDGSPDGCAAICEEYAAADKRFKVIHKPNGGVASARNAGLDAATGEWIGFVDPDDYIEPDMYEYLLTHAVEHGADLSVCGLRIMVDGEQANPWITHYDGIRVLGREQAIEMYLDRNMHDGCVNKLYRRELWRGLRFPAYRIAEDLMAMWEIFQRTNITVRLSDDKYVYCRRTGSATTAKNAQTILDDFNAIKKRHDEVMARWPKFEELSARRCLLSAEGAWEWYFSSATEEQQRTVKPEMRKMARFCVPYWERYNGAGVGVYGRFKYRLARWYPSGWALALGKWTDKLYICLCGAKGKQTEVSAPPPPRAEPENHAVDSLLCVRQENLSAIHWNVSYTQSLRGYKRFLMGRRFKEQVLHGSWTEKQDFFRWSWSKLIHRDNGAKWLCVFDPLESVQSQLRRVDGLNDMIFQAVKRAGIEEDRNAVLKTGRQVFIFAGVHYCDIGGGQRSAQMARAFNDMGYRVYYIHYLVHPRYGEGKEEPLRDGSIFNPTLLHCQVDAFSVRDLDRLVSRGALFIFEVPVDKFEPYLEYAQAHHIPTVYEHIDNWDEALDPGLISYETAIEKCDIAISMDADLQDDVEAVDRMVEKYHAGCDIVYSVRSSRKKDTFFKRFTAESFYRVMNLLGAETVFNHADYRLMSKRALEGLAQFKEVNLFLRGLVPMIGYQTGTVEYERGERFAGESKYPLKKMLAFAIEGITSLSVKPLRIITVLGAFIFLIAALMLICATYRWAAGNTVLDWASIMCSVWAIGGLILLSLGIIGEYIGKIYLETKGRPRFLIRAVVDDEE